MTMDRTYDQRTKRYLDEAFGELVNDCLDDPVDAANQIADLRDEIERLRGDLAELGEKLMGELREATAEIERLRGELAALIEIGAAREAWGKISPHD
jgi:prefoldin subunit 5